MVVVVPAPRLGPTVGAAQLPASTTAGTPGRSRPRSAAARSILGVSQPNLQPPGSGTPCAQCGESAVYLTALDDGLVCWDCMTLEERRRDSFQCERCGAQFHDDGRPSDTGWIVEPDRILCPGDLTSQEHVADTSRFINTVRRGKEIAERDGREYPGELALLAASQVKRLRSKAREYDDLSRLLDDY